MKLSAPIHELKSRAKELKKRLSITMCRALDEVARQEGFSSWSLLWAKADEAEPRSLREILGHCNGGDLVMVAARPGHCKTHLATALMVQAALEQGKKGFFFTLAEVRRDVEARIRAYDPAFDEHEGLFELDLSSDICASHIIERLQGTVTAGSVVVVDYLQLLDEKRVNPPLQEQVEALKGFARQSKCIVVFVTQIEREVEYRADRRPGMEDLRLPNPLDVRLFNKAVFLYRAPEAPSVVEVSLGGRAERRFTIGWDGERRRLV